MRLYCKAEANFLLSDTISHPIPFFRHPSYLISKYTAFHTIRAMQTQTLWIPWTRFKIAKVEVSDLLSFIHYIPLLCKNDVFIANITILVILSNRLREDNS